MLLASQYDQSRYFKADDLVEHDLKLRIREVTEEVIGPKQEKKLVVWFTNNKKGLVLNKVNNRVLRGAFGDPVEGWKGKVIVLFASKTEMAGDVVGCVRVRIPTATSADGQTAKPTARQDDVPPAAKAAKPPANDIDDEITF